ncbi:acyl-CoA thioesterase [Streptomyces oceani]|uniref:Acyl-CoA thioesterase 2 n=1 Tax=Streptomyces oceani TaxID=1075402 RepID=A0A1E7KFU0_9ACTN|nr:acyl-CoA thioesterase II [Streptomyces oceani]OEV02799.1 acyl-CoA thioesterase [Streptomyces oceani]
MNALEELVDLLTLERVDGDVFQGGSVPADTRRVFGGQIAAQALAAACRTVPSGRLPHSLHAYFLWPGDPDTPIVYTVDRVRDGFSFTTRGVRAVQDGRPIFQLTASFQQAEEGRTHQEPMPEAPDPETLPTSDELLARHAHLFQDTAAVRRMSRLRAAVDLRYVADPPYASAGEARAPHSQVWFRTNGKLDGELDDPATHLCLATYVSDMTLLDSVLLAQGRGGWTVGDVVGASLDHSMWFHRAFRADEWLLYDQGSPTSQSSRGLAQGRMFTTEGALAVSVIQEGLVRPPRGRS